MKKILFLWIAFSLTISALAQQKGFFVQYSDEQQDLCGVQSLELGEGYITAAFNFHHEWGSYNDSTPARLFLLSADGELLKSQTLSEGRRSTIVGLYADPEISNLFYVVGKVRDHSDLCDKPFLAKMDENLNILSFEEIELPEQVPYFFMGNSIMDSQGDIVYYTIPYNNPNTSSTNGRIYMRIERTGDLLAYYHDMSYVGEFDEGTLCEADDGSDNYLHLVRQREGYNHIVLHRMDLDFNPLETYEFKSVGYEYSNGAVNGVLGFDYDQYWTMLPTNDNSVLVSVAVSGPGPNIMSYYFAILYKTDYLGNTEPVYIDPNDWTFSAPSGMLLFGFGNDSIEVPARMKSLDISPLDGDLIHCNGVYHETEYGSRLTVTKVDPALETVRWKRTLNLGLFVEPMFVLATSDGGCLITGYSNKLGEERRIYFALKLNCNGFLEVNDQEVTVVPYHLFPNPVEDVLHLEYSPDVAPRQVALYDLLGHILYTQKNDLENICMRQLPAGTYTLHITMEDGNAYSERVVKR